MQSKYLSVNAPGCSIRCRLYCGRARDIGRMILFLTGFGGHKDNRACEHFAADALSGHPDTAVLTWDWPCHGDDVRKKLVLADCLYYLESVIAYVRDTWAPQYLDCYAVSFGGYLVLEYLRTKDNPFDRLALRSPAINIYEVLTRRVMAADEAERLRRGKEVLIGFDRKVPVTQAFLDDLRESDITHQSFLEWADDILILHGTKDEVVPIEPVLAFADDNVIECAAVEGADHRFLNPAQMAYVTKRIMSWFGM